ncbi:hypothetical protein AS594_05090 [Streptomyces agglomeratus]|uniref:Uncharacterized protein n=1 Tax=Streptomyces agglomeratus TaxID=285458 RepID=A0A1E5P306_9ACTN|nr:hypothetical protein [Streptomyces agglomeratus]OEJ23943.1 hypothetical protein AS594_05090 [Streptomyces agglomeratus]OEJ54541.1 hypothetical protein BGK72_30795 [Streptomyces agglomeratus]
MSDLEALLEELRGLPPTPPSDARDLEALLTRVRSAAGRWADVLYEVREVAQSIAGPRTAAALEVAFRRAEESYVELEFALDDCGRSSRTSGGKSAPGPYRE